jgi:UDP-N-acetylmuramoyl-tripeptide--D-alanyl-D-alanine ligase
MVLYIKIIAAALFCIMVYFQNKRYLHMAQLEGYKPNQYWWWLKANIKSIAKRHVLLPIGALVLFIMAAVLEDNLIVTWVALVIWCVLGGNVLYKDLSSKAKPKKPLVFTQRATRLFAASLLLMGIWAALGFIFINDLTGYMVYISAVDFLIALNMFLGVQLMFPIEMLIQRGFYKSAQRKISSMKDLKIIGITGSYGKTSTKYFVKTILSEKYNTLMTPESYNTPMGITRVIREQLNEEHQVFVCEMGARYKKDIKTLVELVHPSIGIITSIGPQHLETLKSIENVAKTKFELVDGLQENGTAILNGDNEWCRRNSKNYHLETWFYGIGDNNEGCMVTARDVKNTREGLKFTAVLKDGREISCHAPILGKHNVSNILSGICTALKLGMTPEEIQSGISKIKPVPHRLELMTGANGITIIDDAFNANPVGARDALQTMKELEGGNKIVITPGMVELGAIEQDEHRSFGKKIGECCDYAILVGVKRTVPIAEGIRSTGFDEDKIITVASLDEATVQLGRIVRPGDVVLFENDLPDNYNGQ